MYDIQHFFICRPSDFTVSEDAEIELRTVATTALAVIRSNHSAWSHPFNTWYWKGHKLRASIIVGHPGIYSISIVRRFTILPRVKTTKTKCNFLMPSISLLQYVNIVSAQRLLMSSYFYPRNTLGPLSHVCTLYTVQLTACRVYNHM